MTLKFFSKLCKRFSLFFHIFSFFCLFLFCVHLIVDTSLSYFRIFTNLLHKCVVSLNEVLILNIWLSVTAFLVDPEYNFLELYIFLILDLKHRAISVQQVYYLVMEQVFIKLRLVESLVIVLCAPLKIRSITTRKSKIAF